MSDTAARPVTPAAANGANREQGLQLDPYLHVEPDHIYNPLNDRSLAPHQPGFERLQQLYHDPRLMADLCEEDRSHLERDGWLVAAGEQESQSARFYLKYVAIEAHTVCNQSCAFCPVSTHRRERSFMPTELYERIVRQLAEHRQTIDGVSMIHYNEPTVDRRFLDQIRLLKHHGLAPAVITNGTGLTPKRVDEIIELGGLRYLSVNLSTLDRDRYREERGGNHLEGVLRNLDYLKDLPVAPQMDIAVLGCGDDLHRRNVKEITAHFAGSRFTIKPYEIMDRAGSLPFGLRPDRNDQRLRGCQQTGSRPLQWIHVIPSGECLLCCQDYHRRWVVGDLTRQTLHQVLTGKRLAQLRRWAYGVEEAPADFICRSCIYARHETRGARPGTLD